MNASIVAIPGWIMPAPLQTPPIRIVDLPILNSTAISLRRVSVVMIASATCRAFDVDLAMRDAHARMPRSMFFIGIATPIRPVEQTRTSFSLIDKAFAANWIMLRASLIPRGPVAAFAFPEFTTIPRAKSFAAALRLTFTGAAQIWFVVNTPATAAGTSETIKARSHFCPFSEPLPVPSFLMSQKSEEHLKLLGAHIEPEICRNGFFKSAQRSRENRASDSCIEQPGRSRL